jgi:LysM repeat protein
MVANDVRHIEPPLRLTRRGRAVVLGLLVLLASVASAVLFTTASRAEELPTSTPQAGAQQSEAQKAEAQKAKAQSAGTDQVGAQQAVAQQSEVGHVVARPTIIVQPGDTLWDIATREMPELHGQAAVDELRRLNALDGYGVHAGDVLILPFAQ